MRSRCYITFLIGLGLAGCAEVPITKTNCWSGVGPTVTSSTKGASQNAGLVSRASTSALDAIPCE